MQGTISFIQHTFKNINTTEVCFCQLGASISVLLRERFKISCEIICHHNKQLE